jgi:hypothetical protein
MVIGCFGDDFAGFVDDDFHALPPLQRPLGAAAMLRSRSNFAPAPNVPMHEGRRFRIAVRHIARPIVYRSAQTIAQAAKQMKVRSVSFASVCAVIGPG